MRLEPHEATRTAANYVCSDCWGPLRVKYLPQERLSEVSCYTEGCECRGFIGKATVERRQAQQKAEAMEVRCTLEKAGVIANPLANRSTAELLKELGF